MGLRAMEPNTWIEIDQHYEAELAQKRELLKNKHDEVFAALPQGEQGSKEVLAKLLEYLPVQFSDRFPSPIEYDQTLHPLEAASLLVQEDLVIMSPQDNQWVLTAASVCFPSRWDLASKVGANLHGIHEPVPHYEERIGTATDVMFNKLTPDRPVWRVNWTVLDSPDLFQPAQTGHKARAHAPQNLIEFGENMFFRTERQTLWKLPESGDILFTIRTYSDSINSLAAKFPEFRSNLGKTMTTASEQTRAYKGWSPIWQDMMAWANNTEN